jgi:hypothetical protein
MKEDEVGRRTPAKAEVGEGGGGREGKVASDSSLYIESCG